MINNKFKDLCDSLLLKISNGDISVTKCINDVVGYILVGKSITIQLHRSYVLYNEPNGTYVSGYALKCADYIDFSADDNTETGRLLHLLYNECESVILKENDNNIEKLIGLI